MKQQQRHIVKGFSLLEMSIVLAIIAVVVGMSMMAGTEQVKVENISNSKQELQQIKKALRRYGQHYGRLPCPASSTLTHQDAEYGMEATDCSDATPPAGISRALASGSEYVRIGTVPVYDLGLPDELMTDAWGNRYFYAVSESNIAALDDSTDGYISVNDNQGNSITTGASYLVGSFGPSGRGAVVNESPAAGVMTACDGTATDGENCDNDDAVFADSSFNDGESDANFYDDLVFWDTPRDALERQPQAIPENLGCVDPCSATPTCTTTSDCCSGTCDGGNCVDPSLTCTYNCIANGYDGPGSGATVEGDCWYTCANYNEVTAYGGVNYSGTPLQASSLDNCEFDCNDMYSGCTSASVTDESGCSCTPIYDCIANGYDGPTVGATSSADCWFTCASHEESTSYGYVYYSGTPTQASSLSSCTFDCTEMDAGCIGGNVADESSCSCEYDCIANGYDGPSSGATVEADCYNECSSFSLEWRLDTADNNDITWKLAGGLATETGGPIAAGAGSTTLSSSNIVSGKTYTFQVMDADSDGLNNGGMAPYYVRVKDSAGSGQLYPASVSHTDGAFAECTGTFDIDTDCDVTTAATMSCSGGSGPSYDCIANGYDGPVALQADSSTCYYTCASYQESTSYGNVSYSGTPTQANSLDSCTFSCTDMDASCDAGQVTSEASCTGCGYCESVDASCTTVGSTCSDGTILADGDGPNCLYVTPADNSTSMAWSPKNEDNMSARDIDNGQANTKVLSDNGTISEASDMCLALTANTHSDWYLPSINEMLAVIENESAIGGFVGGRYWSSTESTTTKAYAARKSDGLQVSPDKAVTINVRCVTQKDGWEGSGGPSAESGTASCQTLVGGNDNTCAVGSDGNTYCWGAAGKGRLGNNSTSPDQDEPVQVHDGEGPGGFTQVDIGWEHGCGIASDGKAYCWGEGSTGRLGNGDTVDQDEPVEVHAGENTAGTFIYVATGWYHSCGIATDGKAYCWGEGNYGRLGNNSSMDRDEPVEVHAGENTAATYTALALGKDHSCGLGTDTKVYCWGMGGNSVLGNGSTSNQMEPVEVHAGESPGTFTSISSRSVHNCAIGTDDKAYCWGQNHQNHLGDNTTTHRNEPVEVHAGDNTAGTFVSVSAGQEHTCGLGTNGKAYCWGNEWHGQLGNGTSGTMTTESEPVEVLTGAGPGTYQEVVAGAFHGCGLGTDDKLYCWGWPNDGQLGNNDSSTVQTSPVEVNTGEGYTPETSCVSYVETEVCLTDSISVQGNVACGVSSAGKAYCWGRGQYNALGNNDTSNQSSPVEVHNGAMTADTFAQINGSTGHSCALDTSGAAYCWGTGSDYRLGNNSTSNEPEPVAVAGPGTYTKLAVGDNHSCALATNMKIYCWSNDLYGQQGDGADGTSSNQVPTKVVAGESPGTFTDISSGNFHSCAVGTDKAAYCWGNAGNGRLGDGTTSGKQESPVEVHAGENSAGTYSSVSAGNMTSCGIGLDEKAYCWGYGANGVLGNNATSDEAEPVEVHAGENTDGTFLQVAVGTFHACGLGTNQKAYCWGNGASGKLGNGTTSTQLEPVEVSAGAGPGTYTQISTGGGSTCALGTDGNTYCWGEGLYGVLGNGSTGNATTPVLVVSGEGYSADTSCTGGGGGGAPSYDCIANGWDGPVALQTDSSTCYYTCASYEESTPYGNVSYSGTPTQANSLDSCTFACTDITGCVGGNVSDVVDCSCLSAESTTCAVTCGGTTEPTPGAVCTDGSINAGVTPDGDVCMYTTSTTLGSTRWVSVLEITGVTNSETGKANTSDLAARGSFYTAAYACENLSRHGNTDWYLPATDEATVIASNAGAIGGFNPGLYWTSVETDMGRAVGVNMLTSTVDTNVVKNTSQYVRCVRKDSVCTADGDACSVHGDCCSGFCLASTCTP